MLKKFPSNINRVINLSNWQSKDATYNMFNSLECYLNQDLLLLQ